MTANRTTLLALASRVEAATGADRKLDTAVYRAACPAAVHGELGRDGFHWNHPPAYTASLDAAMSLIGQHGAEVSIYESGKGGAKCWMPHGDRIAVNAATPALALTAASLRAIAGSLTE